MNEIQKLPTEEEFIKLLKLSEKKIGKYMAYFLSDGLTNVQFLMKITLLY